MSMFVLMESLYTILRYFCASLCSPVPLGTLLFSQCYCCAAERVPLFSARCVAELQTKRRCPQFLDGGRYVAVVVDGKMKTYG